MKKNKVLIVFLIGLLLVTGLVLTGCGTDCGCNRTYKIDSPYPNQEAKEEYSGKCNMLFCAKDMDTKKECECRYNH